MEVEPFRGRRSRGRFAVSSRYLTSFLRDLLLISPMPFCSHGLPRYPLQSSRDERHSLRLSGTRARLPRSSHVEGRGSRSFDDPSLHHHWNLSRYRCHSRRRLDPTSSTSLQLPRPSSRSRRTRDGHLSNLSHRPRQANERGSRPHGRRQSTQLSLVDDYPRGSRFSDGRRIGSFLSPFGLASRLAVALSPQSKSESSSSRLVSVSCEIDASHDHRTRSQHPFPRSGGSAGIEFVDAFDPGRARHSPSETSSSSSTDLETLRRWTYDVR